jgi:hypothetical protein
MAHDGTCDADSLAVVVDWLDACRTRDLLTLLELYYPNATLECDCERVSIRGLDQIASYWRPKLFRPSRSAFKLIQIAPLGQEVSLDYMGHQGIQIETIMSISAEGQITRTMCWPAALRTPVTHETSRQMAASGG